MVEVRVNLGIFEVSLEQLISLREGKRFDFVISPAQDLDLYVGDEKIAEAKLLQESGQYYLEISKILLRD